MARPTQPKDAKPKAQLEAVADGGDAKAPSGGGGFPIMMIAVALVVIICSAAASAASVYFLAPIVLKPLLSQMSAKGDGSDAAGGDAAAGDAEKPKEPTIGPVLALDEFTVNLKDPGGQRYLRANLSLTITADNPQFEKLSGEALKKWEDDFHLEMGHYVPTIRDICISALTKHTAAELSTAQGKEEIKEEIKHGTDAILQGKHKVIRVNFENFIIQ